MVDHQGPTPAIGRHAKLGPRDLEVLRLAARGRSTKQNAEDLSISPHTAHSRVRHSRQKLGARPSCKQS